MTAPIGASDRSRCAAAGRVRDPAFGGARELQRRVAARRPRDARSPHCDLRLRAARRPDRRRGRRRPARAARRVRAGSAPRLRRRAASIRCCSACVATVRAVPAPARAVPASDRGEPSRPAASDVRDVRRARWTYCDLSANPVGELVLHVFGAATPERIALSDRVCTALQLAEHWQDVGEDFRRGRIYLPAEDRRALRRRTGRPRTPAAGAAAAAAARVRGRARAPAARRGRRCSSARCAAARGSRSPATSAAGAPTLDAIAARRLRRARRHAAGDAARRRLRSDARGTPHAAR